MSQRVFRKVSAGERFREWDFDPEQTERVERWEAFGRRGMPPPPPALPSTMAELAKAFRQSNKQLARRLDYYNRGWYS